MDDLYNQIEQARATIAARASIAPRIGMILGSGLGSLADELEDAAVVPYAERALGCDTLIATNAAGGLRPDWAVGDLMRIADQIFLPGMAGHHPLRGENDDRLGLRFPAMVGAFDAELRRLAHEAAAELGITLREGVYLMLAGPAFESGAELRMCRALGADVVGMSTAPEVTVARHAGMRALGISLVTNLALPDGPPANHEEVLAAGEAAKPRFAALLKGILARM